MRREGHLQGRRIEAVDVARGLASLIMIQGHAYDGWVAPAHKLGLAYQVTRLLGSLPLPAFLVLSGAAVGLRVEAAVRRGEPAQALRRALVRRGLTVVAWGYVVNVAYAVLDGGRGLDTWLRVDVLHVIGLSIASLAWLGLPAVGQPNAARLRRRALGLAVVAVLACPWLSASAAGLSGPARYAAALWVDVPDVTRMPWVPLVAWVAAGIGVSGWLVRQASSPLGLLGLAGVGGLAAAWGALGTAQALAHWGGELTRAHPAVIPNVIDGLGRGLLVLGLGGLCGAAIGARARAVLVRLGQASLVTYVLHIPFCYGRLGALWAGRLDMWRASGGVLALMGLCYLAVWLRQARARRASASDRAPRRAAAGHAGQNAPSPAATPGWRSARDAP